MTGKKDLKEWLEIEHNNLKEWLGEAWKEMWQRRKIGKIRLGRVTGQKFLEWTTRKKD